MPEPTNDRKLEAVITTLTIMQSRLTQPWDRDCIMCINMLKEVRDDLKEKENGNDEERLRPSS
jgi:hypothetical protein